MNLNYDEIVKTYFNQKNILVQHQINSYEEYIDKKNYKKPLFM